MDRRIKISQYKKRNTKRSHQNDCNFEERPDVYTCSCCNRAKLSDDYSNSQLKKAAKRNNITCKLCITRAKQFGISLQQFKHVLMKEYKEAKEKQEQEKQQKPLPVDPDDYNDPSAVHNYNEQNANEFEENKDEEDIASTISYLLNKK